LGGVTPFKSKSDVAAKVASKLEICWFRLEGVTPPKSRFGVFACANNVDKFETWRFGIGGVTPPFASKEEEFAKVAFN
jgi:hypothetical protein